jgi:hypothetical protein
MWYSTRRNLTHDVRRGTPGAISSFLTMAFELRCLTIHGHLTPHGQFPGSIPIQQIHERVPMAALGSSKMRRAQCREARWLAGYERQGVMDP